MAARPSDNMLIFDFCSPLRLLAVAAQARTSGSGNQGRVWIAPGTSGLDFYFRRASGSGMRHRAGPAVQDPQLTKLTFLAYLLQLAIKTRELYPTPALKRPR
jgi:hypothetical protein